MIIYENRRVEFSLCWRKIQLNNYGSMVKRLRLSPLTAATGVRIPLESPKQKRVGKPLFFALVTERGSPLEKTIRGIVFDTAL